MKYIKVEIKDIESGKMQGKVGKKLEKLFKKHNLAITEFDNFDDKLLAVGQDEEHIYYACRFFDLEHRGRLNIEETEEIEEAEKIIKEMGFKLVDKLPAVDI